MVRRTDPECDHVWVDVSTMADPATVHICFECGEITRELDRGDVDNHSSVTIKDPDDYDA